MSNYPILWQNIMLPLRTETGQTAFLWAAETRDTSHYKYPAEKYAHEVEKLFGFFRDASPILQEVHPNASGEVLDDLLLFLIKRHANMFWGGNVNMWWEQ